MSRFLPLIAFLFLSSPAPAADDPRFVDLPTVLRLAGADHDEVEFARAKHAEAIAESKQAWQRFWPTLTVGAAWRGHEGNIQDVAGAVFEASKRQYTVGGAVIVDWSPGDIYYSALVAEQRARAAAELAEKVKRDLILEAVDRYYTLLAAEAGVAVIASAGLVAAGWYLDAPERFSWIPELGIDWSLRLDGLNVAFVLLTAAVGILIVGHTAYEMPQGGAPASYLGAVLIAQAGALTAFLAGDALLFFVAFEIVLVPMWFVIRRSCLR